MLVQHLRRCYLAASAHVHARRSQQKSESNAPSGREAHIEIWQRYMASYIDRGPELRNWQDC